MIAGWPVSCGLAGGLLAGRSVRPGRVLRSGARRTLDQVSSEQRGSAPGQFRSTRGLALGFMALLVGLLGPTACGSAPAGDHTAAAATASARPPVLSPPSSPAPPSTTPYAGPALIDHVQWAQDSKGRVLRVYPTDIGRTATGAAARTGAWREVVAAASPAADTAAMSDQFSCHWDFARIAEPHKSSWNLEAWRPDVGYAATVQAECNPGGPE